MSIHVICPGCMTQFQVSDASPERRGLPETVVIPLRFRKRRDDVRPDETGD